jgi:sulfur carrier protein
MTVAVTLNGETTELQAQSVSDALQQCDIAPDAKGIAVAVNGVVVPRMQWAEKALAANDSVEIVKVFAGG